MLFNTIIKYTTLRTITINMIFRLDMIATEFIQPFVSDNKCSEFFHIRFMTRPSIIAVKIFKTDGNIIPKALKRRAVLSLAS